MDKYLKKGILFLILLCMPLLAKASDLPTVTLNGVYESTNVIVISLIIFFILVKLFC